METQSPGQVPCLSARVAKEESETSCSPVSKKSQSHQRSTSNPLPGECRERTGAKSGVGQSPCGTSRRKKTEVVLYKSQKRESSCTCTLLFEKSSFRQEIIVNPDLPHHDRLHLGVGRFCLGMVSLGATICFGYGAFLCWFGRHFALALGGRGDTSEILGVTLPYPIMMSLLVVMCVLCAFVAVYALFFPTQSDSD